MALRRGVTPGRSEFSHGKGQVTEPTSDFQSTRGLVFPQGDDENDLTTQMRASTRVDATVPDDVIMPDMLYLEGNPDTFGPGPKLVQEKPNRPVGLAPQPKYRTGVYRQP